ncbi:hypothetical protein RI367_004791 [Sorochytrium milnesiophthora]
MTGGTENAASGTQVRKVWIYRNGDTFFTGRRVLVTDKLYKNMEQLLQALTPDMGLRSGAVRKLFDTKGHKVEGLAGLADNGCYIAAGNEPYRMVTYPVPGTSATAAASTAPDHRTTTHPRSQRSWGDWGLKGQLLVEPESAHGEKPIFQPTSKCYKVCIFRCGDTTAPPHKMVLGFRNCRTFEQLMNEVTLAIKLPEGRVRGLFDAQSYRRLTSLHDIHDGQNIIASGSREVPRKLSYKLSKLDTHDEAAASRAPDPQGLRGKIITVFRNGDITDTGVKVTVTLTRFKDLKRLLEHIDHEIHMWTGKVTRLASMSGEVVQDLEGLHHGGKYVAIAGTDPFQNVKYNVGEVQPLSDRAEHRATTQETGHNPTRTKEVLQKAKQQLDRQKKPPTTAPTTNGAKNGVSSTGPPGKTTAQPSTIKAAPSALNGSTDARHEGLKQAGSKSDIEEAITVEATQSDQQVHEFETKGTPGHKSIKAPGEPAARRNSDRDFVKLQAALTQANASVSKSKGGNSSSVSNNGSKSTLAHPADTGAHHPTGATVVQGAAEAHRTEPTPAPGLPHQEPDHPAAPAHNNLTPATHVDGAAASSTQQHANASLPHATPATAAADHMTVSTPAPHAGATPHVGATPHAGATAEGDHGAVAPAAPATGATHSSHPIGGSEAANTAHHGSTAQAADKAAPYAPGHAALPTEHAAAGAPGHTTPSPPAGTGSRVDAANESPVPVTATTPRHGAIDAQSKSRRGTVAPEHDVVANGQANHSSKAPGQ